MGWLLRAGTRGEAGGGEEGGAGLDPDARQGGEPWLADQVRLADQSAARRPVWRGIGRRFGVGSAAGLAWDRWPVWRASHLVWRQDL